MKNIRKSLGIIILALAIVALGLVLLSCDNPDSPPKTYTVSFDANGGSGTVPSSITVQAGSGITLPNEGGLSKIGYIFGGWSNNAAGAGTIYSVGASYTPSVSITLYAKWDTDAATYTVNFDANGGIGTTPDACTVNAGSAITIPGGSGLSKNDYIFGGWNTDPDGMGTNYQFGDSYTVPNRNVTLYALWEASNPGEPLRAEPIPASDNPAEPKILDSFRENGRNWYIIDAGYIRNSLVMQMGPTEYSGFGTVTLSMMESVEESMTRSRTETVSNSIVVSDASQVKIGLEVAVTMGVKAGVNAKIFSVESSLETTLKTNLETSRTVEVSSGKSTETSESFITSLTQSLENLTSFTINRSDPVGHYRYAWYTVSDVYFIISTSSDNQELLSWDVISCVRGSPSGRLELSSDGRFDNSPTGNLIVFAENFHKTLPIPSEAIRRFDFSNSDPSPTITIPGDVTTARIIGQYPSRTFNTNIVIASRTTPLVLYLDKFGMVAPVETVGINSASSSNLILSLSGSNRIIGGAGRATASGGGQSGNVGATAISVNGGLIITGGGNAYIAGGAGTAGNTGIDYDMYSREGVPVAGGNAGNGGAGGAGISARGLSLATAIGDLTVIGGQGGAGGVGGQGRGTDGGGNTTSGAGGKGGAGGAGGRGVVLSGNFLTDLQTLGNAKISGGNGGAGGKGGRAGEGYGQANTRYNDDGGPGGTGGNGGNGGVAVYFENQNNVASGNLQYRLTVQGGTGGNGGVGGQGGNARTTDIYIIGQRRYGIRGPGGAGGNGGNGGIGMRIYNKPTIALEILTSNGGNSGSRGADGEWSGRAPTTSNPNGTPGSSGNKTGW